MTERSPAEMAYRQAEAQIQHALQGIIEKHKTHLQQPFKYRMVSQAQAGPAERTLFRWSQSNLGPHPVVEVSALRAAIYNQAAGARQLEAFIRVSRTSFVELGESAVEGFKNQEISVPYMMLRSLVERTASATILLDAVKKLPNEETPRNLPSKPLIELAGDIGKALYGTKVDWKALLELNLRDAAKSAVSYVHKELTMDVSARSILTSIDKLDRRVPGARIAYEVLCEFLHPNVGDLYSTTVRGHSLFDEHQTRHIVREIGLGPKDLSAALDLQITLAKVLNICCDVILLHPALLNELEAVSLAANEMARKSAHRARKKYRDQFNKTDLCPCLSGLRVRDCR